MGAVGEDEAQVLNPEVVHAAGVSHDQFAAVVTASRPQSRPGPRATGLGGPASCCTGG